MLNHLFFCRFFAIKSVYLKVQSFDSRFIVRLAAIRRYIIINYYYIRVRYIGYRGLENDGFKEFIAAHYRISINVERCYGNG
jgi:hypothetical protein